MPLLAAWDSSHPLYYMLQALGATRHPEVRFTLSPDGLKLLTENMTAFLQEALFDYFSCSTVASFTVSARVCQQIAQNWASGEILYLNIHNEEGESRLTVQYQTQDLASSRENVYSSV